MSLPVDKLDDELDSMVATIELAAASDTIGMGAHTILWLVPVGVAERAAKARSPSLALVWLIAGSAGLDCSLRHHRHGCAHH